MPLPSVCLVCLVCLAGCKYVTGPSTRSDIIEFKLEKRLNADYIQSDIIGKINKETKTIDLVIPRRTDHSNLIATLKVDAPAQVFVGGVTQISGKTKQNFTSDVVYAVQAENGTIQNYTVKRIAGPSSDCNIRNVKVESSKNPGLLPGTMTEVWGQVNIPMGGGEA